MHDPSAARVNHKTWRILKQLKFTRRRVIGRKNKRWQQIFLSHPVLHFNSKNSCKSWFCIKNSVKKIRNLACSASDYCWCTVRNSEAKNHCNNSKQQKHLFLTSQVAAYDRDGESSPPSILNHSSWNISSASSSSSPSTLGNMIHSQSIQHQVIELPQIMAMFPDMCRHWIQLIAIVRQLLKQFSCSVRADITHLLA